METDDEGSLPGEFVSAQSLPGPAMQLVFPQIAWGEAPGLFVTATIILVNPGENAAEANLKLWATDGADLVLTLSEALTESPIGTPHEFSITVPASQTAILNLSLEDDLRTGWLKIDSGMPLSGVLIYLLFSTETDTLLTQVGVTPTPASRDFFLPVVKLPEGEAPVSTSIALSNDSDQTVFLKGTLANNDTTLMSQVISLGPRENLPRLIEDLFPEMAGTFVGQLRLVRSDFEGPPTGELDVHPLVITTISGILAAIPVTESAP